MDKYLNLLTDKISDLYRAYEDHAFNNYLKGKNDYRLVVNFKTNNTIHFILYEKNKSSEFELMDEVYLGFEENRTLYEAISLNIFAKALGNVTIHKLDHNMYYNAKHKPYVLVIVEDKTINNLIQKIIENQEEKFNTEIIDSVNKCVKSRKIHWSFLSQIEDRTALVKELFRRW